jgi:hypothetical protein
MSAIRSSSLSAAAADADIAAAIAASAAAAEAAADAAAIDYTVLDAAVGAAGFRRVPVPSDGDCFFHSLVATGLFGDAEQAALRKRLVDAMLARIDDLLPFVVREYKVKSAAQAERYKRAYVTTEIKKLLKSGIYNTDLGDIVPQYAAGAFGVRLSIYNWNWTTATFTLFDIQEVATAAPTHVHLVRLNENHYDLLVPAVAVAAEAVEAELEVVAQALAEQVLAEAAAAAPAAAERV